ncbi:MAG: hypothetical protein J6B79_01235 [Clostridia bacterium]|nr:hypothetical protein [Clostridia bacterium]
MEFVTIKNDLIKVEISLLGAKFHTITDLRDNEQLVFEGSEGAWAKRDLVLFPFACRRVDGWYEVDGKRYEMPIHGFAKLNVFEIDEQSDDSVTLLLRSNDETRAMYPYDFEFRIRYSLIGNKVKLDYFVKNTSDKKMYFSLGGHLAFKLDGQINADGTEDTKGNFIEFSTPIKKWYPLKGAFVLPEEEWTGGQRFEVDKKFLIDHGTTPIFTTKGGAKYFLERKNGRKIAFETKSSVVAFWSDNEYGQYVCVEPWWGVPDDYDVKREISQKTLMESVEVGETYTTDYIIEII